MFARITWFQSSPERLDGSIAAYSQHGVSGLTKMRGNTGAALLVNRVTGAGAAVSYWDSLESLQASEDGAVALRSQTASAGQMTIGEVDRFELVLQERMAPASANTFVRINDLQASPDKIDSVAGVIRDTLPTLREQKGFRAVLVGANRQTGRMFIGSVWDTAADREASDAAVNEQRRRAGEIGGARNVKVDLYEAVVAEVKQTTRA